ncbi:MAG TPA: NadS family protein [Deltaproteobacteria bacterium]|jgi:putative transcriptional regulator|nr:NadS family protein [Deltaproteobacteria bacterium]HQJ08357.1 NadS family protein [Deltaproteobacteria bacterium]
MKKDAFSRLVESIRQAGEIKKGTRKPNRVIEHKTPDIKNIRKKLRVSQAEFALMIGVSTSTLQNWEQGRREPEGPAKALLKVAEKDPEAVFKALHT